MRIQVITKDEHNRKNIGYIINSPLDNPKSLDEFDINIVDLSSDSLWYYKNNIPNSLDEISDLVSIRKMVERKSTSCTVFVLPHNNDFYYDFSPYYKQDCGYQHKKPMKDCLEGISCILEKALPCGIEPVLLEYENTKTIICDKPVLASFYFDNYQNAKVTESMMSKKTTTIDFGNKNYLTTLQVLDSCDSLLSFIKLICPPVEYEATPEWAQRITVLDDKKQLAIINDAKKAINEYEESIQNAKRVLRDNARIKSIIYTSGDELVSVIYSILERILACDLLTFIDKKREDFLIKKDGYTLIGEIKGVSSNIKSEHISQVDVHYQSYLDDLASKGENETVHQVLIMNPFRNKPIDERDPVNETQIRLAERNGCLIVETEVLLKLYEKFASGGIDVLECEELFSKKTGLLRETDFS